MNRRQVVYLRAARAPILLITVGILFAIHQAGVLSIEKTWPLLLIVLGAMILLERLAGPPPAPSGTAVPPSVSYVPAGGPARRFTVRRSIAGPLIVILIGVLFLLQALSPDFSIWRLAALYWPYVLVAWGVVQLLEISAYAARQQPVPVIGGGGTWLGAALICLVGSGMFLFYQSDHHWWYGPGYRRGFAVFGPEHQYPISPIRKTVSPAPRVVIEGFRGDTKISGADTDTVVVSGRKTIRAIEISEANRVNGITPVRVSVQGDTVTVHCEEASGKDRLPVTASIDVAVPKGASIQMDGLGGDLSISSLTGGVDLTGHGGDVDLQNIAGRVTIQGHYEGMLSMRDVAQAVHIENMGTHLDLQRAPGEIRMDRGTLSAQNVVGPITVNTDATDVTLRQFTEGLDLSVNRGDVELYPSRVPLSKMDVHAKSGDIDLYLPQDSTFHMTANTRRGDIENEFGDSLAVRESGQGAHLLGAVGDGPDIHLTTDRGTITVRKSGKNSGAEQKAKKAQPSNPADGQVTI